MRFAIGAVALGLGLIASACSPAPEKTVEAPAAETPAPTATPEPAAAPAAPATPTATSIALEITDAAGAKLTGDTARGQRVFAQCMTCHSAEEGVNRTGPSLYGIIGRKAGTIAGFRYSDANKNSGITWTEQEMYTYLENPKAKIPGTIMAFVGLKNSQQRADVIAYLKQNAQK
jgi:cytochrome c